MSRPDLKEVIASAVKSGSFGDNLSFIDLLPTVEEGKDQFASDVVFAKVILKNGEGSKEVRVVIKRQQDNAYVREMMNTDLQFYNEDLMYKEILPFLAKRSTLKDIFPEMFHSHSTLGKEVEKDIIVIEDLRPFGYKLTDEKIFLDHEHIKLALKKIGQFHAFSYAQKKGNSGEFFSKVGKLKETTWVKDDKDDTNRFLIISLERGISRVIEAGEHVSILERFMSKVQDPFNLCKDLVRPEEPLAVICHGDFNRNNMLFKYDDSGKPVDVKFFDVATARYSSPAIDLAFFLMMNSSAALRREHWQEWLAVYHEALAGGVAGSGVPSLEVIRREVERKAVYGYVHCSFFIPMMMDDTPKCELEDFATLSPEELDEITRSKGGDPATEVIADIVRDLVTFKSIT